MVSRATGPTNRPRRIRRKGNRRLRRQLLLYATFALLAAVLGVVGLLNVVDVPVLSGSVVDPSVAPTLAPWFPAVGPP